MKDEEIATKNDLMRLEKQTREGFKQLEEKIVTMLDNLAVAVAKGFEETATKEELKAVESRLTNVESRLTNVENRLGNVENRLGSVEEEVKEVKAQMIFRKDDVNNLKADTPSLSQFNNHEKRISRLEKTAFA